MSSKHQGYAFPTFSRRQVLFSAAATAGALFTPAIVSANSGVRPSDFGGDMTAWAAAARPKYLPAGTHLVRQPLRFDGRFQIDSAPNASLVAADDFRGDWVVSIAGWHDEVGPLAEEVENGAQELRFARPHGLAIGDALIMEDQRSGTFWPYANIATPRRYRAGAYTRVAVALDPFRVLLDAPLRIESTYSGFMAEKTRLWRLRGGRNASKRYSLRINALQHARMALRVNALVDPLMEGVVASGGLDYGFWMERCINATLVDTIAHCCAEPSGREYGLAIISCAHTQVRGGYFFGSRHAITVSGGGKGFESAAGRPPSSDTTIRNAQMASSDAQAADISHAPNIRTSFIDCTTDGLAWGGADGSWIGGIIRTAPGLNNSCLFASEMVTANTVVAPNVWHYTGDGHDDYFKAVIDFDGSGRAIDRYLHQGGVITIGGTIFAPNIDLTQKPVIRLRNAGYIGDVSVQIGLRHTVSKPVLVSLVPYTQLPLKVSSQQNASPFIVRENA